MAYPKWVTPAGNLGKIAEQQFYELPLVAYDPEDFPVTFSLQAGRLPAGMQLLANGSLNGQPIKEELIGVPAAVAQDRVYQFTVRATSQPPISTSVSNFDGAHSQWILTNGEASLRASGLPYHSYGNPLDVNQPSIQNYRTTFALRAGTNQPAVTHANVGKGIIGYWLNGVAVYNPAAYYEAPDGIPAVAGYTFNAASPSLRAYFGLDLAGGHASETSQYHYHSYTFSSAWQTGIGITTALPGVAEINSIPVLKTGLSFNNGHSRILGFALDGYPIYGPYGYSNPLDAQSPVVRIESSYGIKSSTYRTGIATDLVTYPMGIFVEDFEFKGDPADYDDGDVDQENVDDGHLDQFNGRFCVTPDYPEGTYAYFATINADGTPAYPYVIGPQFYSDVHVVGTGAAGNSNGGGFAPTSYVATQVSSNTSQKFISDRSFQLTITGNQPPELLTGLGQPEPYSLGQYLDGTAIKIQLSGIDPNYGEPYAYRILSGSLPTGLSLDTATGLISGIAVSYVDLPEGAQIGWDESKWDLYPWQFPTRSQSKNYQFTIEIYNSNNVDHRHYSIEIVSHNLLTADNLDLLADDSLLSSDLDTKRPPILITQDLGIFATYTSDNYFSFKFDAVDLDGDAVTYSLASGSAAIGFDPNSTNFDESLFDQGEFTALPGSMTLHEETGWLSGYIPPQLEASKDYTFSVAVYKTDYPSYITPIRIFKLTVLGSLDLGLTWTSPSDLGSIQAGSVSQLQVTASSTSGQSIQYALVNGSRLPAGLQLINDGTISGKASFQSFSMDSGNTTFDVDLAAKGYTSGITTFDKVYKFTVTATTASGAAQIEKTFSIAVSIRTSSPFENIYIKCLPDEASRTRILEFLHNTDVFRPESIYRPNDPYWGRRQDLVLLGAYGITASTAADYIAAMQSRHYNKRFLFGEFGVSRALDSNNNTTYEVIWVEAVEETRAYNNGIKGEAPDGSYDIRSKISGWQNPNYSPTDPVGYTVKINDQQLMNRDISDSLGVTNLAALPAWMTSVQKDGTISGYVTRIPLAYLKPGEGDKALFLLNRARALQQIPDLTSISFVADRYVLDDNLSFNYDLTNKKFVKHHYATFDSSIKFPDAANYVGQVDFAIDIPFDQINGRTQQSLINLGGLDSVVTEFVGKTIVFARQENYTGYDTDPLNQGWVRYTFFDDVVAFDGEQFDQNSLIPGWNEHGGDPTIPNQRGGIWKIGLDDNNLIQLNFVQQIEFNQVLGVNYGAKYGGNRITYTYDAGQTVPAYVKPSSVVVSDVHPTTFDGNSTRFLANTDPYQTPLANDKYLKFPKIGVFS
jgi:hypothetical protein